MNTKITHILFDLDGVLFIEDKQIEGAADTLDYLRSKNIPMRFLTNTTTRSLDSLFQKISRLSLPIEKDEIFAPPKIAAHYLKQFDDPKLLLILEEETKSEFRGIKIDETNPDYIVIGHYSDRWNYNLLNQLFKKIMNGSKMLALHKGRYWQTDQGLTLDIGAFVAGLEHATSTKAIVIGKPSPEFFITAMKDMNAEPSTTLMVGDDIINDIKGAADIGVQTALVKTGKYRPGIETSQNIHPDFLIDSVAKLKDMF